VKKYFLTGLVTLLPVAVTTWIIVIAVRFLTRPFMGIVTHFLNKLPKIGILNFENGIQTISQILILIGLFLFTIFLGLIARRFFFNSLINLGDRLLYRIPLVNKVYKTSKEIVSSLFASNEDSFKQVVLLPFPYRGSYSIGLISSPAPQTCSDTASQTLVSVFIPTTPNPMTGFLVMVPKEELIYLEMKTEEAFKYVVSCAVITPGTKS
jgi:uncharacterized membrane protein